MGITDLVTYHPFKAVWGLLAILLGAARLPLWIAWFIIPSLRQHPRYTFRQALKTHIVKTAMWNMCVTRVYTPLKIKHAAARFVTLPASTKSHIYTGIATDKSIKPQTISGYWYPSPYDPASPSDKGKKVILHFHGGAFVIGTARDAEATFGGSVLAKHVGKSLWLDYRLSSNTGGRFPAPLQDAVTAYQYLLDQGIPASDIVIGGDSAGGNLAVALLRYIATTGGVLPDPHAALLWSPWVDVSAGLDKSLMPQSPHYATDYLTPNFGYWGASTYAPALGPVAAHSEWISPKKYPFKSNTAIWVQTCGQEVLFEDDKEFAENMKGVEGNRIGLHIEEVANHDIILAGKLTGFEDAANRAASQARRWLDGLKK